VARTVAVPDAPGQAANGAQGRELSRMSAAVRQGGLDSRAAGSSAPAYHGVCSLSREERAADHSAAAFALLWLPKRRARR